MVALKSIVQQSSERNGAQYSCPGKLLAIVKFMAEDNISYIHLFYIWVNFDAYEDIEDGLQKE